MREKIIEICCRCCNKKLEPDEAILGTGILSSYELFYMVCELENELGIELSREDITNMDNFTSLRKIICLIEEKYME